MRLKSVVKYNISETKNSILIFYGIMAALLIVFSVISTTVTSGGYSNNSGGEVASAIFLFVVGLNSFKQNFLFLSTNGVTRKTCFYGFVISSLIIATGMAVIDTTYGTILGLSPNYSSLFTQLYNEWAAEASKPLSILISFVWNAVLYLFTMCLGYFITTLYYRMSKGLKITVSVGIPVFFTIVLPIIDSEVTNGRITKWIGTLFVYLMGVKGENLPLIGVLSLIIAVALLLAWAFMLVRRAPVKE